VQYPGFEAETKNAQGAVIAMEEIAGVVKEYFKKRGNEK
jgi:hypothetical protein